MRSCATILGLASVALGASSGQAFAAFADIGIQLSNLDVSGSPIINLTAVADSGSVTLSQADEGEFTGTLQPGRYVFRVYGRAQSQIFLPESNGGAAAAAATLTLGSPVFGVGGSAASTSLYTSSYFVAGEPNVDQSDTAASAVPFDLAHAITQANATQSNDGSGRLSGSYGSNATGQVTSVEFDAFARADSTNRPGGPGYNFAFSNPILDWRFEVAEPTTYTFDGRVSAAVRGASQQLPTLPVVASGGSQTFTNVASGNWVDPPAVDAYEFAMTGGSLFTRIEDFPTGFDDEFTVSVGGVVLGTFGPGEEVDFVALLGAGVSAFKISGIDPLVDGGDPTAFPVKLAFDTPKADFTMSAVPEPTCAGLVAVASASLLARRRRRA